MSKQDDDAVMTIIGIAFILFLFWAVCQGGPKMSSAELEAYYFDGPDIRDR